MCIRDRLKGLQRTELPEVTNLIYEARENCLELIRAEARKIGAERVMSTRLQIRELGQGLVEIVAIGTAVRRAAPGMQPQSPALIPQALILDRASAAVDDSVRGLSPGAAPMQVARHGMQGAGQRLSGCLIAIFLVMMVLMSTCGALLTNLEP